mmetsp:Transcript_15737/g.26545  ORF Transcript_15737/g.26545 Transcript_15737/m.26545 type:complete len:262 (+) Transcript_15737:575-1360(+)
MFDFLSSICVFSVLVVFREEVTPDLIHFLTCMVEEEAHFVWIMFLWLNFKCFLSFEKSSFVSEAKVVEERLKLSVRGLVEVVVALFLTSGTLTDNYTPFYCLCVYALAVVRSVYKERFDLFWTTFVAAYAVQNLVVNLIDYVVFQKSLQIYDDMDFVEMFSFKLYQILSCALLSFVFAQCSLPSFECVRENAFVLRKVFSLTLLSSLLLVVAFAYELKVYDQHKRSVIFKGQMTKVFFAIVTIYLLGIIFSSVMLGLIQWA